MLEDDSQCSRQLRWIVPRVPVHSQGESRSSWLLPSWQILHIGRSLKGLLEEKGEATGQHAGPRSGVSLFLRASLSHNTGNFCSMCAVLSSQHSRLLG